MKSLKRALLGVRVAEEIEDFVHFCADLLEEVE